MKVNVVIIGGGILPATTPKVAQAQRAEPSPRLQ